ncbi:hypothetical protein [Streptomyces sp. MK37H]|uniref:hypothetical protein n=1 Tax=Streptomyces sp. MK37H TaxID=2699117 RepID=UPI001B36B5F4|nr:hypothetical protein [Streptomyces sp. MK37H]
MREVAVCLLVDRHQVIDLVLAGRGVGERGDGDVQFPVAVVGHRVADDPRDVLQRGGLLADGQHQQRDEQTCLEESGLLQAFEDRPAPPACPPDAVGGQLGDVDSAVPRAFQEQQQRSPRSEGLAPGDRERRQPDGGELVEQKAELPIGERAALGQRQRPHPARRAVVVALGGEFDLDPHRQIRGGRIQPGPGPALPNAVEDVRDLDRILPPKRLHRPLTLHEQV